MESTETKKPKPSLAPIYAAALYPELAVLFRSHGYALAIHGSLQRDFDVIAIPWIESPSTPDVVVEEVTKTFDIRLVGEPTVKLHGRTAWMIAVGFGQCAIDLSFMPAVSREG
jgi:hypothetical protein